MKLQRGYFELTRDDRTIPGELRRARSPRLSIWNVGFKAFEQLADFPNLVEVRVLNYPLDTLAPFGALPNLRRLELCHFPKARSLAPLAGLGRLRELRLAVPGSWSGSGKSHAVDGLGPLAGLRSLRSLEMTGVVAADGDLSPLAGLKNLQDLSSSNLYPQEQLARLAGLLPKKLRRGFLQPFVPVPGDACRKCGTGRVMLSGCDIRPRIICPCCKKEDFESRVSRFNEISLAAGR